LEATNLLANGDFEEGRRYFATDYVFSSNDTYPEGRYSITTSPNVVHPDFVSFGDHSTGRGRMMVVNGATIANQIIWQQSIEVKPDEIYAFSGYIRTVAGAGNPGHLSLYINTSRALNIRAPYNTREWQQFSRSWVSGKKTTLVTFSIVNNNTTAGGNDFAIDDLEVWRCRPIFAHLPKDNSLEQGNVLLVAQY
jgi:hypothetical protein